MGVDAIERRAFFYHVLEQVDEVGLLESALLAKGPALESGLRAVEFARQLARPFFGELRDADELTLRLLGLDATRQLA